MNIWHYLLCTAAFLGSGICGEMKQCYKNENPGNNKFILDDSSWDLMLQGEWMIGFCVPLVMPCIRFERAWSKFALVMKQEKSQLVVASMKLEYSETVIRRFSLHDLPTILHVKDGVFRKLPVSYSVKQLKELAQTEWKNTEPFPFWQHPNGFVIYTIVLYVRAIDWVYEKNWLDMDYDRATWLVRIGLVLIVAMFVTISCGIYAFMRDRKKQKITETDKQLIDTEKQLPDPCD